MDTPQPPPIHAPPTAAGALPSLPPSPVLAILSLVLGMCSLMGAVFGMLCMLAPAAAIPAVAAIALGWISLAKRKPGRGMAWAGVITGLVGLLLAAAITGFFGYAIWLASKAPNGTP
jgi:hypothetical protein